MKLIKNKPATDIEIIACQWTFWLLRHLEPLKRKTYANYEYILEKLLSTTNFKDITYLPSQSCVLIS